MNTTPNHLNATELLRVLGLFFADVRSVCGTEATYLAALYHHLRMHGIEPSRLDRSHRIGGEKLDLVVFSRPDEEHEQPTIIEFKGGAQGKSNSLKGYVTSGKEIKALKKITNCGADDALRWLLCLDLPELGVALNRAKLEDAAESANKDGIGFAYCNPSDEYFSAWLPDKGRSETRIELNSIPEAHNGSVLNAHTVENAIKMMASRTAEMNGSEDTFACQLYNALREQELHADQVALETYFSLSSVDGSRMQLRPDLTVFDRAVEGNFNLYKGGDTERPNDPLKLQNLRVMVELKGSAAMNKAGDKKVISAYLDDIKKLARWRSLVDSERARLNLEIAEEPRYVFVGVDNRETPLNDKYASALRDEVLESNVDLYYIHRGHLRKKMTA